MMLNSFNTTVATPRKCPGRKVPSHGSATFGGWIELVGTGGEHEVDAQFAQRCAILFERARIPAIVFVGAELRRIDENADHRSAAVFQTAADQRQMARVQRAHGRDEADAHSLAAQMIDLSIRFTACGQDVHGGPISIHVMGWAEQGADNHSEGDRARRRWPSTAGGSPHRVTPSSPCQHSSPDSGVVELGPPTA